MADMKAALLAARARKQRQADVFDPPVRGVDHEANSAAAAALREQGNSCFASGDLDGADAKYAAAVDLGLSPTESSLLWSNRALVAMHRSRWEDCREACDRALELHPPNVKACYRRALAHEKLGDFEAARADAAEVVSKYSEESAEGAQARALQTRLPASRAVQLREPVRGLDTFAVPDIARREGWGEPLSSLDDETAVVQYAPRPGDSRGPVPERSDYYAIDTSASEGKFVVAPPREDMEFDIPPLPNFLENFDPETGEQAVLDLPPALEKGMRPIGAMPTFVDENIAGTAGVGDDDEEEESEADKAAAAALLEFCNRKRDKDATMARWRERWGD